MQCTFLLICEEAINDVLPYASMQPKRYLTLPWLVWNTVGVLVVQVICLHLATERYQLDVS